MDRKCATVLVASILFTGCAELNEFAALVRAPQFEQAPDHHPEIRMSGPASGLPARAAGVA